MSTAFIAFSFFSNPRHDPYIISGFLVSKTRAHSDMGWTVINKLKNKTKVMKAMGFKTVKEYIDSYPGNFRPQSIFYRDILQRSGSSGPDYINIDATRYVDNPFIWPLAQHYAYVAMMDGGPEIIYTPTMEEAKQCKNLEGIEYNEMWFCSDWKEDSQP